MLFLLQLGFGIIANKNNANDNTSGVATLLSIMEDLPEDQRPKVCFVFFDNEEKGLVDQRNSKVSIHKQYIESHLLILIVYPTAVL